MLNQLVLNGLIAGSIYALVALGFVLIYSTARFFDFAHGISFAVGAYGGFALGGMLQLSLFVALPAAALICAMLGAGLDVIVYRPLRRRKASALVLLLVSLGVYIVLQNVISLAFGDDAKRIAGNEVREGIALLGGRMTPVQMATAGLGILLVGLVAVGVWRSRIGVIVRAVANDSDLAAVRGINNDRVITGTVALGSLLAGTAGILAALDVGMVPTMGMRALMMAVVAVIIGGVTSPFGAACGGLLLGFAQQLGVWKLGAEWQDAIAFAILAGFLIVRPQGVWGKPLRKAAV